MNKWNPDMVAAPKDGTRILVWRQNEPGREHLRMGIDYWKPGVGWYRSRRDMHPTHWMHLPAPPQDGAES